MVESLFTNEEVVGLSPIPVYLFGVAKKRGDEGKLITWNEVRRPEGMT